MTNNAKSFTLGQICHLITDGKHGDCNDESDSGFFFISAKDVRDGKIHYGEARQITRADFEDTHRRTRLAPNDILVTNSGTIGRLAIVPDAEITRRTTFQKSVAIIKPDTVVVLPKFLYYTFHAHLHYLIEMAGGTAQKNLLLGDLRRFKCIIPDLTVQRKIAAILSAYDELIENNQRRIALLEKMAEEIYREWFVRLRFPGHEKVKKVKGVPDGWELVKLERAFNFTGGGTPSKGVERFWNGGDVNWFTPSDITGADGIFLEKSGDQCTEEGFNNSSAKMFPAYSVMLTSRATIGAIGINTTPACTNQGFITCIPNERYPLPYLYHWLKLGKPHFELLAGGATFAELTKGTFKRIEIFTPPEPIVTEFARIESPLFKNIEALLQANRKLVETRNKLLPRLISGKLSVENLNIPPGMAEGSQAGATAFTESVPAGIIAP